MKTIVFVLVVSLTAVQSEIINIGPTNYLKKVSDRVELRCVTDVAEGGCTQVDWQKIEGQQSPKPVYQYKRGLLNPGLFDPQRYNISDNSSGCILIIRDLKIEDSGRFVCMHSTGGKEDSKSSVLVVVSVTQSCVSNVTNNELVRGDSYYLTCAINLPSKSLEPSEVTLSLPKYGNEMMTTDNSWEKTVASTAYRENITRRVCEASFEPVASSGFDATIAKLEICSTEQWTVFFPVEDVTVTPSAPCKGDKVSCAASGHPPPTFSWKRPKTDDTAQGHIVLIEEGEAGEVYLCTATNTIQGRIYTTTKNVTICEASTSSGCGAGCIVLIIVIIIVIGVIVFIVVAWKVEKCPLHKQLHSLCGKSKNKGKLEAGQPLNDQSRNSAPSDPPKKPPRSSDAPRDV